MAKQMLPRSVMGEYRKGTSTDRQTHKNTSLFGSAPRSITEKSAGPWKHYGKSHGSLSG